MQDIDLKLKIRNIKDHLTEEDINIILNDMSARLSNLYTECPTILEDTTIQVLFEFKLI